jgi:hypothetical protein
MKSSFHIWVNVRKMFIHVLLIHSPTAFLLSGLLIEMTATPPSSTRYVTYFRPAGTVVQLLIYLDMLVQKPQTARLLRTCEAEEDSLERKNIVWGGCIILWKRKKQEEKKVQVF